MTSPRENSSEPSSDKKQRNDITVPRDAQTDADPRLSPGKMPSPAFVNITDEDYATEGKPLPEGSAIGEALHARPPQAKGQLGVGSAGDAARPTKSGITHKPIPPRGKM